MMKLTYRDKVIAIVLTVIAILAAGAFLIVKPEIEKYQSKQIDLETKKQEQETVQAKIDTLAMIQTNIIKSLSDIESNQEPFYLEQADYELEQLFHEYFKTADLEIKNIAFTISPEHIIAYQYQPTVGILAYDMKIHADLYGELPQEVIDAYNEVKIGEKPATVIGAMVFDLEFDDVSTWEEVLTFLDLIAELDKTVIINTVEEGDAPDAETGEGGTVNMTATIYNIVPMDVDVVIDKEREIAKENGNIDDLEKIIEQMRDGTLPDYVPIPVTEATTTAAQ
jgi:hypothetical protein